MKRDILECKQTHRDLRTYHCIINETLKMSRTKRHLELNEDDNKTNFKMWDKMKTCLRGESKSQTTSILKPKRLL